MGMSLKLFSADPFEVNSRIGREIRIFDSSILTIEQKRLQFAVRRAELDKLQQVIARRRLLSTARCAQSKLSRRAREVRRQRVRG